MNLRTIGLAVATAALLFSPALAQGQGRMGGMGGMGGGGRRGGGGGNRQGGGAPQFSSKDMEKANPITLLIDKRKDLNLTTPQLEKLANLNDTLKAKNDTIYQRLDSLSQAMRSASSSAGGEAGTSARGAFGAGMAQVRENFAAAAQSALAVLDDRQRKPAQELLDKQRQDNEHSTRRPGGGDNGEMGSTERQRSL